MPTTYKEKRLAEKQMSWLASIVASAQTKGWHGTLTVKFRQGVMTLVVQEETRVPPKG